MARGAPGDWVETRSKDGKRVWQLVTYELCRNGHPLGPGQVSLGWIGCGCGSGANGGHTTVMCWECRDVQHAPPCAVR
jgi:hypothetical protein